MLSLQKFFDSDSEVYNRLDGSKLCDCLIFL